MRGAPNKIRNFYSNFHGHLIEDLEVLHTHLRAKSGQTADGGLIWLAGDSSLDNKYWIHKQEPALAGYQDILDPPRSLCDIAHCLNREASGHGIPLTAVNCAVEESCIASRACGRLLPQDVFLRDHVRPSDVVIVSVGGNDIALQPSICTILNILLLICCSTTTCIESCSCGCALPCDDCCAGCGPGCMSCCLACPPGLGYFIQMFSARVQSYVERLISGAHKPRKVLVCMIYYPSMQQEGTESWADFALGALRYNNNPSKLQALIRRIFKLATQRISIPGTQVVAVPLFEALDPVQTEDYVQRVEPSASGGSKMARLLLDAVVGPVTAGAGHAPEVHDGMARP